MPSGYTVKINGVDVDLDDIFAARTNSPTANVNYKVNDVDLSDRFEPITTANQQIAANTNFKSGGIDFRDIFVDKNFTPTPTQSDTPTPTPSVSVTNTPTPTITPTVTPTPSRSYY